MAKGNLKTIVEELTLDYHLAELPSSQHRAGLAGLVCIIRWLERQPAFREKVANGTICKLTRVDELGATLKLNQSGVKALFDEIYAASTEEQERPQRLKSKDKQIIPPIREVEREVTDGKGKTKTKITYVYPIVVPTGSFLADPTYDKSVEDKNGLWIKLWRDMVWSILRGVPATRKPFEARAEGSYSDDATSVWQQLIKAEDYTVELPSTYFLGAQANNAENVPFKDRARLQFLLHFWLFAAQIYVPAVIDNENKRNFVGYALAIPDVANLEWFCDQLPEMLSDRSIEKSGYRPRDAIVDLAVASALDIMERLRDRLQQVTGEKLPETIVFGIDVIHTEKQGNNIRVLSSTRLDPEESMIDQYVQIRDGFWSPLFRKQCLLNLVNHKPWHYDFDRLLSTLPYELSIGNTYFQRDVREQFDFIREKERIMASVPPGAKPLMP